MPIYLHSASAWQRGKDLHVKHNGVWKNVVEGHVNNALSWQRFHVAEETVTLNADASAVEVASLFDSGEWSGPKTKRLIIPNGVTVSGTNFAPALEISSGWNNLLTIENNGIIQGIGGAANSGVGGDALVNNVANDIIIENYGTIRSGGGGGGLGGVGGGGKYSTSSSSGPYTTENGTYYVIVSNQHGISWIWGGSIVAGGYGSSKTVGSSTYYKGAHFRYSTPNEDLIEDYYAISRTKTVTNYTTGGTAGAGGEGVDGLAVAGSIGASGGTNAGTGGTGGAGGSWGLSGADGAAGSNGNNGSGTAGSLGGLAGFAYKGQFNVTNSGTILGRI